MRSAERDMDYVAGFLARVALGWREDPDMRFGQFVANVGRSWSGFTATSSIEEDLAQATDEGFRTALDEWDAGRERVKREWGQKPRASQS
jgi:hypothetical protein